LLHITIGMCIRIALLLSLYWTLVQGDVCDEQSLLAINKHIGLGPCNKSNGGSSSPWGTTWTGKNCYDGHGGKSIGGNKQLRYEKCFNLCAYTDGCSCFVSGLGLDNEDCYLLSQCKETSCDDDDKWITTVMPGSQAPLPPSCPVFPSVTTDSRDATSDPVDPPFPTWAFDSANLAEGQGKYPQPPYDNNLECGIDLQAAYDFDYLSQIGNHPDDVRAYLVSVYGQQAVDDDKVQLTDSFRFFWNTAPLRQQITIPRPAFFVCEMRYWQPYTIPDGNTYVDMQGQRHAAAGFWLVPHDPSFPDLVQDDEWVEVTHFARLEDHTAPEDISSVGQMWYWMAPGSGIWLNVGKAVRYDTAGLDAQGGCPKAIQDGYDTIINTPWHNATSPQNGYMNYGGMVEIVDCRGAQGGREVNFQKMWEGPCPPPGAGALRSGLPNLGSDYSCECRCDMSKWYLNCEGQ